MLSKCISSIVCIKQESNQHYIYAGGTSSALLALLSPSLDDGAAAEVDDDAVVGDDADADVDVDIDVDDDALLVGGGM